MRLILAIAGLLLWQGAGFAISCAGGDTMQALAERWGAEMLPTKLSADGFELFLQGKVECVTFVREPFATELAAYKAKFGAVPLLVPVAGGSYATRSATHAIAIYVNQANPLTKMTMDELEGVFSGRVSRWPNGQPIHVYGMLRARGTGNPPGIVNFLQNRILHGAAMRDDVREQIDQPGETALDAIVHRVAEDPLGIGFSGFAYAAPGTKTLALAETAAGPYYRGSPEEVAARLYPLSRLIYLMVPPDPSAGQRDFLRHVLSDEGQAAISGDPMGFLPLTAAEREAARARFDRRKP